MGRNLLLSCFGLLIALATAEAVLRVVDLGSLMREPQIGPWHWTRYDPIIGHGNVLGFSLPALQVSIDTRGFRGAEVAATKAPETVRVVCLGDSTTFGIWVDRGALVGTWPPYPTELERLAQQDGRRVEVVNAGVLGATSSEALAILMTQVLPLHPDVVTVRVGNNDHARGVQYDMSPMRNGVEYELMRYLPSIVWRSDVVRLAVHGYRLLLAQHRGGFRAQRLTAAAFEENLRRFVTVTRENGIRLAFLDFPYREQSRGLSPGDQLPNLMVTQATIEELFRDHESYQAIVAKVASETGTPLVRTTDALRAAPEPTFSDFDMTHPNGNGYRIIGRRLYEELGQLGWLEQRR